VSDVPLSREDEPQPLDEGAADEEVAAQALESDPGGNGPHGLAGDLGVSSGIRGADVGSSVSSTHGARPVQTPPVEDPPPEQSPDAAVGGPETPTPEHPDDYREQTVELDDAQPHSHG
jgi:hypothetical protein